jgi:potassium efflux system protein
MCRLLFVLMLFLLALPAAAAPTLEEINAKLAEVERRPATEPSRDQLLQLLQQARNLVQAQRDTVAENKRYAKTLASGPSTVKQLESELRRANAAAAVPFVTGREVQLSLAELQQALEAAVTERTAIENKLSGYELRDRALQSRPAEIVQDKNRISARIDELELEISNTGADAGSELSRARTVLTEAEIAARRAELDLLNQEQLSHGIRLEINSARRRLAEVNLARATAGVGALEQLLLDKRQAELQRILDDATRAQRDAVHAHPLIRELAKDNTRLSRSLSEVLNEQAKAVSERAEYSERRQRLNAEFDRARQRTQIAGASSSLGRILVDQRRRLPELRSLRRLNKLNETKASRVGLARIEIDEKLRETADAGEGFDNLGARLDPPAAPLSAAEMVQAGALFSDHTKLLNTLDENLSSYLRMLDAADFELQQLTTTVANYSAFLDERLLWMPNAPPLSLASLGEVVTATQWFLSPLNWSQTIEDVRSGTRRAWPRLLLVMALVGALVRARSRLRNYLTQLGEPVGAATGDRLRNTLVALLVTTLIALPLPLALWLVADLLTAGYAGAEFSIALGQLSAKAAQLLLALLWVRVFLGRNGVALKHFLWPQEAVERVRRRWLSLGQVFVPAYAIATAFEWGSNPAFQYSLRRLLFMLAMGVAAWFGAWLTKRAGVLHHQMALYYPSSWVTRGRPAWALIAVGAPLVLMVLSGLGYHYTALVLSEYYLATVMLALGIVILHHLALRWLRVAQQRIAAKAVPSAIAVDGAEEPAEDHEPAPDLAAMNEQAHLIIRNVAGWTAAFALYWVWHDVLPALTVFDKVTLWQIEVTDSLGAAQLTPITIANAGVAVVMLAITMLAARNVPGVLEIALLQRLGIHRGSRYAITTLVQYFIVALGVTLALGTLGLRWSQVQWLIAALGVGLGFGLQEIFANFISGLILLFERPIRVGDVVTIGDLSGKVSKIQIRATTISDMDNREIIVPNKNFITERFVNWTLTDQITRVVIDIGVAYGSDIDQVEGLLRELAASHPKVLKEPPPQVLFNGFGDSALNFQLMVHAREMGDRLDIRHEMNSRIFRAFKVHGIEIPFPQRDVHVRSLPATAPANGLTPG